MDARVRLSEHKTAIIFNSLTNFTEGKFTIWTENGSATSNAKSYGEHEIRYVARPWAHSTVEEKIAVVNFLS